MLLSIHTCSAYGNDGTEPHVVVALCLMCQQIGHDIEHVGLTNDYLINTDDTLAIIYSDRSPMVGAWGVVVACAWLALRQVHGTQSTKRA